ncbi:DMT family transporter [Clostridium ganghwense]|uniref:DMT family transporter n=1 Tax=Clostridium ganghwense TaxID=312089 RepID=A0ABT4CKB7_9CLOT|nr:DMT family transporter [Clostridium ganghwense]MCY6369489.1 DMT family transporter [Clostridium ganghwense]
MLYIILAFAAGCLVILSMIINSHLAKRIGVFQGTFINYIVGLLFTVIVLLFRNNAINLSFNNLSQIPFWAYLGGLIGVIVVAISNVIIPKIPTIYSTLLIFLGQLFTGIIIDSFTGNLISKGKLIGGFLIIAGLVYNFNVDKKHLIENE